MKNKFTSRSTNKLKLDTNKYNIPEGVNVYGTIFSQISKLDLAKLLDIKNWSVRMCTSVDFEVECEWVKLILEGNQEILIHGGINERKFDDLIRIFEKFELVYSLELYNYDGILIKNVSKEVY